MGRLRAVLCLAVLARAASAELPADPWRIPAPGACASEPPLLFHPPTGTDVVPIATPKPGEVIDVEHAERLHYLVPPEIWDKRERFFFDGMQLEIGPCYRDYGPPQFFVDATRKLHDSVSLDDEGELYGHRAGLPFPPELILRDDPRAALKWAWNFMNRWAGAGSFGRHQVSIVNDHGVLAQWQGDHFFVLLRGRLDHASDGYQVTGGGDAGWAAGGLTKSVQTGAECVFRQYQNGGRRPDLYEGTSYSRNVQRVPQPPDSDSSLQACLVDATIGAGLFTHGEEPALHEWTLRGVADVLAPINAKHDTWPRDKLRGYGPWGISFADDRWELRRVLVLEGKLRKGAFEDGTTHFVWYLDLQTLAPLYYAAYRANGNASGIGYFVSRWSDDRPDYPHWEDDPARPVRVLDNIGSALVDWNDQHAVRHEEGDEVSIPPSEAKLRRELSVGSARIH